jgi:hypothetical protein
VNEEAEEEEKELPLLFIRHCLCKVKFEPFDFAGFPTNGGRAGARFDARGASSPPNQPAPQSPLLHTRFTPNTQRSAENCPYRA